MPLENATVGAAKVRGPLVASGARVLGVPCNTFHAKPIFEQFELAMREFQDVRIVNMIDTTIMDIRRRYPSTVHIGVLSTTGTKRERVFSEPLSSHGLIAIELDEPGVERVHAAIYDEDWGIKATGALGERGLTARRVVGDALESLESLHAELVILGCTELPLAVEKANLPLFDPLDSLATAMVDTFVECFRSGHVAESASRL
jgi:aspartate racemase